MTKQVFACIDGSRSTEAVCSWSSWVSLQLNIPLILLHVLNRDVVRHESDLSGIIGLGSRENLLEELSRLDEERSHLALVQGRELLELARKFAEQLEVKSISVRQMHGNLIESLAEIEDEVRILVIGRQGEESQSKISQIGSQVENVIRTLHRPVLVTLPNFKTPKHVMIAYDGSPTGDRILKLAAENPLMNGMNCHIVMVGTDSKGQLARAQNLIEQAGHNVVSSLQSGEVDTALLQYARDHQVDLIVMGAYGHSRIRQFLVGSHTTKMLYQAKVPLLFLR